MDENILSKTMACILKVMMEHLHRFFLENQWGPSTCYYYGVLNILITRECMDTATVK